MTTRATALDRFRDPARASTLALFTTELTAWRCLRCGSVCCVPHTHPSVCARCGARYSLHAVRPVRERSLLAQDSALACTAVATARDAPRGKGGHPCDTTDEWNVDERIRRSEHVAAEREHAAQLAERTGTEGRREETIEHRDGRDDCA